MPPGTVEIGIAARPAVVVSPRSIVPSLATAMRRPSATTTPTGTCGTTRMVRPCGKSVETSMSRTTGNGSTALSSWSRRTCSVVMSAAASESARRTRPASGPETPVTRTW